MILSPSSRATWIGEPVQQPRPSFWELCVLLGWRFAPIKWKKLGLSSEASFRNSLCKPVHVSRSKQRLARAFSELDHRLLKDGRDEKHPEVLSLGKFSHACGNGVLIPGPQPFATSALLGSSPPVRDGCASGPSELCLLLTSITAQSGIQIKFKAARQHSPAMPIPPYIPIPDISNSSGETLYPLMELLRTSPTNAFSFSPRLHFHYKSKGGFIYTCVLRKLREDTPLNPCTGNHT